MNPFETLYKKTWTDFKAWPWYCKLLGGVFLLAFVVLATLWIAMRVLAPGPKTSADEEHAETVDAALEGQEEIRKKLDETINAKKSEMYKYINSAAKIDATTLKNRQKIYEAKTMEELDELQKNLGL